MFEAVHLTVLRVYPFPEPVFQPSTLAKLSFWERLHEWQQRRLKNRRPQTHRDLFNHRASLRSWLMHGYPIVVPNLGILKPLRKIEVNPERTKQRDCFYSPFFSKNILEARDGRRIALVDANLRLQHGPLPCFPIQLLLDNKLATVRHSLEEKTAVETLLGQSVRSWQVEPMLIIYPAGAIAAQMRLYVETVEPLQIESLMALVHGIDQLPWQIYHPQADPANALCNGRGAATLLDYVVKQFRQAIISTDAAQLLPEQRRTFTLITPQGTLIDPASGQRHHQVREWVSRLAGVKREEVVAATLWGKREGTDEPWLVAGSERAVFFVDDAVRKRVARTRSDGRLLEGRRALRNRAIGTMALALVTHQIYTLFHAWLEDVMQDWELEPLEQRWVRFLNFTKEIPLNGRIYGTLFYEVAALHDRLAQADRKNKAEWIRLYAHVLANARSIYPPAEQIIPKVLAHGRKLYDARRERQAFQLERLSTALELISGLIELLSKAKGEQAAPPATPSTTP